MIVWALRGYSDPEGEFETGAIVCAIERSEDGYRLLLEHNGEIQLHENHAGIDTARGKAEVLKDTLIKAGWTEPTGDEVQGLMKRLR